MLMFIFATLVAAALAAPQRNYYQQPQQQYPQYSGKFIPIVSETNEINPDGSFSYSYATGDGQQAQAQGYLKNAGVKDQEAEVIQGSYSYTAPDGTPITITYIADENGFRAEGAHLPTPPPIPEAIQKSLALIAQTQKNPQSQYQPQYQPQYRPQYQQPRPFSRF
ncbi:endocuticle structural glycoprotein SgAbd-2 [Tribolium castaneum]|uniref:endocuticle structural glycoprotein SgAbd-2 n=1 Tax=Tribolium castaneum TaxID=7070 RepID=UPI0000D56370|nr:PREDICTED: endocuticle structural glycoprotein SgAbd-2 [Tribolium castaneum]|eukprot:XP_974125.1 PREDICTED: endocuticle structural glycoprotein SgAbd-2 [Tribolium castaneum]